MGGEPVRELASKVLRTSYEPVRIHSAALRHTLQAIQDDPEIQAELEARGIRLLAPPTCPNVFVEGNRQGIYILLRDLIRQIALRADPDSELRAGIALTEDGLCVSVAANIAEPLRSRMQGQLGPLFQKILADMNAQVRQSREPETNVCRTEFRLALFSKPGS